MAEQAKLDQLAAGPEPIEYFRLLKPRVMSLVVFSGFAGLVVAPGWLHPVLAFTAILCIALGSGAAGAINMWYDRDIDALMARTRNRALPQGRMEPGEVLGYGVSLAVASVVLMGIALNWVAAAWLAAAILFYVLVYTIGLKRRTPQNIVIGGAAGAFPPVIGWAAVTGDTSTMAWLLFLIIFLWTPPHFWALSLYRSEDYARAGVPMLPVVKGLRETRRQIVFYSLILVPVSLLPYFMGLSHWPYGLAAALLGGVFWLAVASVVWHQTDRSAKRLFGYSILYLFLLFSGLMVDNLLYRQ
ncbi:MAG: heme o synthase [Candidatus Pacebacteria bacterium]|nr:heme o synthase [Candidatus Paceibacterota bacterium]